MPNQGQSFATEAKERGFTSAFDINLRIVASKCPGQIYFHFDLNAGSGVNSEVGCIGSPLAFLDVAARVAVPFRAFFVDIEGDQIRALLRRDEIRSDPKRCFVVHGDNAAFCDAIPDIITACGVNPAYALGSVLVDDNGAGVPVDRLVALLRRCPRLDFFWNVTATGLKRAGVGRPRLDDILREIPRRHFLIRREIGKFQWTMIFARNIPVGEHKREGIVHLDGQEGQAILARCTSTIAELREIDQARQGRLL